MFETTFNLLQASPFAILPLAVIVWFVGRTVRRSGILSRIARYVFVFGVLPPFGLFLLAELVGNRAIRGLARTLLDAEVHLALDIVGVVDSLLAAVLRAFLQFVAGLVPGDPLSGITSALPSWNPFAALSATGFLVAVFVVHFVTGVVVIRLSERDDGSSVANEWLTVAGVVLFVSGMVWTLLQFDPLEFGRFELQTAVLASSMGLITGVAATNLPVDLMAWRSDGETDDEADEAESKSDTPSSAASRSTPRTGETTSRSKVRATETTSGSSARPTEAASSSDAVTTRHITALQRLEDGVRSLLRR